MPIGVSIPCMLNANWCQYTSGHFSQLQPSIFGIVARKKFDNINYTPLAVANGGKQKVN